jgi:hypothetical protein
MMRKSIGIVAAWLEAYGSQIHNCFRLFIHLMMYHHQEQEVVGFTLAWIDVRTYARCTWLPPHYVRTYVQLI